MKGSLTLFLLITALSLQGQVKDVYNVNVSDTLYFDTEGNIHLPFRNTYQSYIIELDSCQRLDHIEMDQILQTDQLEVWELIDTYKEGKQCKFQLTGISEIDSQYIYPNNNNRATTYIKLILRFGSINLTLRFK